MKLAFYRAQKLYQKAIAWWTRPGPYAHVELVLPNYLLPPGVVTEHDPFGSLCFSSSEQDDGTRFKLIDLEDGKWDLIDVPAYANEGLALNWCLAHRHIKYDWRGLRGFVFPWEKPNPADLFCSEAVVECLQDNGFIPGLKAGKTSPNALFRALNNGRSDARS